MTRIKTEPQGSGGGGGPVTPSDDLGFPVCLINSEEKTVPDRYQLLVYNEFKVQDDANLIVIGEVVVIAEP